MDVASIDAMSVFISTTLLAPFTTGEGFESTSDGGSDEDPFPFEAETLVNLAGPQRDFKEVGFLFISCRGKMLECPKHGYTYLSQVLSPSL